MLQGCRQAGSSQNYRFCVHLFADQIENRLIESKVLIPSMALLLFFFFRSSSLQYWYRKHSTRFLKLLILYWGTSDEQTMWWFRWTAKGFSRTCTWIPSPPDSPPVQDAAEHWAEFPVPHSRFLLLIHFKYSSVRMSIPSSLTLPSPHPATWQP